MNLSSSHSQLCVGGQVTSCLHSTCIMDFSGGLNEMTYRKCLTLFLAQSWYSVHTSSPPPPPHLPPLLPLFPLPLLFLLLVNLVVERINFCSNKPILKNQPNSLSPFIYQIHESMDMLCVRVFFFYHCTTVHSSWVIEDTQWNEWMNEPLSKWYLPIGLYICRYSLSHRKIRHCIIPPLAFWHKYFNYPLRRLVHINKTLEKENSSAWYYKFRKITNFLI